MLGQSVRDPAQERLKTQIQKRVIAKAQALPLAAFENPELYNQLQRVDRGLDEHFFNTTAYLFRMGNQGVTLGALLLYVGAAHPLLPGILAAGTAVFVFPRIRLWREKYLVERQQTERERRLSYLEGLMAGREAGAEVRLFDLGDHLLRSWGRLYGELRDERLRLVRR